MTERQMTINFFDDELPPSSTDAQKAQEVAKQPIADDNRLFFISLGSGSSGNCSYIGTSRGGILVDAGVRAENVENMLCSNGISMNKVKGIIITHDHADHVRYAYALLRQNKHLHLFCSNRVLTGMLRRHSISKRIKEYHRPIFKEIPFSIGDFEVTAFDVPHDGSDNMGFFITTGNHKFVIATDLGQVQERADFYMQQANYLVIEANYDAEMLRKGPYPVYLKARIATDHGHLDNADAAAYLAKIAPLGNLSHIFLCHLSKDNNTPQIALQTVHQALINAGVTVGNASGSLHDRNAQVQLSCLPRFEAGPLMVFRK